MDVADRLRSALSSRYELVRELGRGGMAYVYLAHDQKHDRDVAIKIIRPELSEHVGATRFLQEIQITSRLQHPHILPVFDSGDAGGLLYYVMPYVQGESLRERLTRERQLPITEAVGIAREVADALGYAHSHGVVHRDVKPENILLADGHALVADFGIARMMHEARGGRLTDAGVAIGTPAYMSPEQAGGDGTIDGRADLYALGCVLYEMLAGTPPFSGSSAQAVLARHMREPPPPIQVVRPTVPDTVERALAGLLAKTPADRFATASQFLQATRTEPTGRRRWPTNARRTVGALVGVAVVTAVVLVARSLRPRPPLDPHRYLVLSCRPPSGMPAATAMSGDACGDRLRRAFERWDSVDVVNVGGAAATASGSAREDLARRAAAGVLVESRLRQGGGVLYLTLEASDLQSGAGMMAEDSVAVGDAADDAWLLVPVLRVLLGASASASVPPIVSTRSLPAVRAYLAGRAAAARGDLGDAAGQFAHAITIDDGFVDAQFAYAQTRLWLGRPVADWRAAARRALEGRKDLASSLERELAAPLAQMASEHFATACAGYRAAARRDSLRIEPWLGLAECESRDSFVVPSPASPSRWKFRGSYQSAIAAYQRALSIDPRLRLAIAGRLVNLFLTEPAIYRSGSAVPPDTGTFWAFPTLDHDTFAFVPYPEALVRSGRAPISAGTPDAVQRARDRERAFVTEIDEAYPSSVAVQTFLAQTLENSGDIVAVDSGGRSALRAIRHARDAARDVHDSLSTALTEVRLLVKAGEFGRARALADSVLAARPVPPFALVTRVAALAALVGHAVRAADLLAMHAAAERDAASDPTLRGLPLDVWRARERLQAFAAIGGPADSIRRLRKQIGTLLQSSASPASQLDVGRKLLDEPMVWAYPTIGTSDVQRRDPGRYLLTLQWLAGAHRYDSVRARLASLMHMRRGLASNKISVAPTYQEALLMAQAGDTVGAIRHLDGILNGLSTIPAVMFDNVAEAAALVRAMAYRAALAAARHDTATADRWNTAVNALWRDADPGVRGTLPQAP